MRRRRFRSVGVPTSSFAGFRFPPEVILLSVRWYLRYGLSYRDLEELLAERGIEVDHVTLYRWVQRFTPMLVDAAAPCRHVVGARWFVDETYLKVSGAWRYVYRAVDQRGQGHCCVEDGHTASRADLGVPGARDEGECPSLGTSRAQRWPPESCSFASNATVPSGQVIDVFVSRKRDTAAATRFFATAITAHGEPGEVTTDKAQALAKVIRKLVPAARHDTTQYANNRVEADHGRLKARLQPMRGLQVDRTASVIIRGHAFMQNLRRGHYELGIHALPCVRAAAAFDELARVV